MKQLILVASLCTLIGCQASTSFRPFEQSDAQEERSAQLAAYAASTPYPSDIEPRDDQRIAAVIDRKSGSIRLYNFTDEPMQDVKVWVNGSFVHRTSLIPAQGFVTLDRASFYDSTGRSLARANAAASQIQVQSGDDRMYSVLGPIFQ